MGILDEIVRIITKDARHHYLRYVFVLIINMLVHIWQISAINFINEQFSKFYFIFTCSTLMDTKDTIMDTDQGTQITPLITTTKTQRMKFIKNLF